jgi:hypothetical protein
MKAKWVICSNCKGEGRCLPEGLRGVINTDEWSDDELDGYFGGEYDVPCTVCEGSGKVLAENYFVQLFLLDRAYGGSEEGGWWFDCGEPVDCAYNRGFATRNDARDYLAYLYENEDSDGFLNELNEGRSDINSVTSEGVYDFKIVEEVAPFPEFRPHYE